MRADTIRRGRPEVNPPALPVHLSPPTLYGLSRLLGHLGAATLADGLRVLVRAERERRRAAPEPPPPPGPLPQPPAGWRRSYKLQVRFARSDLEAIEALVDDCRVREGLYLDRSTLLRRLIHEEYRRNALPRPAARSAGRTA